MTRIGFVCRGSILKSVEKARALFAFWGNHWGSAPDIPDRKYDDQEHPREGFRVCNNHIPPYSYKQIGANNTNRKGANSHGSRKQKI